MQEHDAFELAGDDPHRQTSRDRRDALSPALVDPPSILSSIGEAVYDWHIDSDVITWSGNAASLIGTSFEQIGSGTAYAAMLDPVSPSTRAERVMHSEAEDNGVGVTYRVQYALSPRRGKLIWIEDTGRWFAGPDGRPHLAHGVIRLIQPPSEQDRVEFAAGRIDPLTLAFTRSAFTKIFEAELERIAGRDETSAYLVLNIDNLGFLNRSYGYEAADEVIAGVADRLRSVVRGRDRLVRYAGNKLGILLQGCRADQIADAAGRIITAIRAVPFATSAGPIAISTNVGGVIAPRDGRTSIELMHHADEALAEARARPGTNFVAYARDALRDETRRRNLSASDEVLRAINERRLTLAYEPVIQASTGAVAFHEALVRVRRPNGEIVGAGQIVPLAERLGLVRFLDHRVLELAVDTLARHPEARLSVNVSMRTATEPDWMQLLVHALAAHPGVARRMIVEITETAAIEDLDQTVRFVTAMKELGLAVAIDDFGAGHSSFKTLRSLPVDMLKIDGAFIQNLARSTDDRFFVRTLVDLARHLSIKTVAEWVQDAESARQLAAWGVDYLQGEHCGHAALEYPGSPTTVAA